MRSVEEQIGVSEVAKKTFREEILIRISSLARRAQSLDYRSHERLREAIEKKKLFADLRDVVKITTSTKTPDEEQLRRINEVVDRLIKEQGFVCANCSSTSAPCSTARAERVIRNGHEPHHLRLQARLVAAPQAGRPGPP